MPNIYLVGMMGSGKTVTGKLLSLLLHYGFIDLDEMLEEKHKRSISEIFEKEGEIFFRDQETKILTEVCAVTAKVIATGGGTVLRSENVLKMKTSGKVIYLETSLEELWERVKEKTDRPLLKSESPKEALRKIYDIRRPIYERICDLKINTDRKTIEKVADQIFNELENGL